MLYIYISYSYYDIIYYNKEHIVICTKLLGCVWGEAFRWPIEY